MYFMTNRQDILEEQLLRENIRKAIRIVKEKHDKQEQYVRTIASTLLKEATVLFKQIAIKRLEQFVGQQVGNPENPDGDYGFKEGYIQFASSKENRERYVEYILDFANEDFKTIDASMEPQPLGGDFVEKGFESEREPEVDDSEDEIIAVSVGDLEDNDGDVNISPKEEEEEEEEVFQLGESGVTEEENEGIKKISREIYKTIGPILRIQYEPLPDLGQVDQPVEISGKQYQAGELSEAELKYYPLGAKI